jgi:hypothetical protein
MDNLQFVFAQLVLTWEVDPLADTRFLRSGVAFSGRLPACFLGNQYIGVVLGKNQPFSISG